MFRFLANTFFPVCSPSLDSIIWMGEHTKLLSAFHTPTPSLPSLEAGTKDLPCHLPSMGVPITEEMAPSSSSSDTGPSPPTVHTVPKLLTPAASLWLQSRSLPGQDKKYRRTGEDRPITLENLRIALRLLRLSVPRCIALFTTGMEVRVLAVLADRLAGCILPTMRSVPR